MKKLVSLIGAGAMLLAIATPVLARGHHRGPENVTRVTNTTTAVANTGLEVGNIATVERAGAWKVEAEGNNTVGKLSTGDADATAVGVVVADTQVGCSRCSRRGEQEKLNLVENTVVASADTGIVVGNTADVSRAHVGSVEAEGNNTVGKLSTGDAAATAVGVVVVDTQLNFGW